MTVMAKLRLTGQQGSRGLADLEGTESRLCLILRH